MNGLFASVVVALALSVAPQVATASLTAGPLWPLPGYNDAAGHTHGGSTCSAVSSAGSLVNVGSVSWIIGGDPGTTGPTATNEGCTSPVPPPFDTTRFQSLFWSFDPIHASMFVHATGPTTPLVTDSGTMQFDAAASTPALAAQGEVIYQGSNDSLDTATLHFTTTDSSHTPLALTAAADAGVSSALGYVLAITPSVPRFEVTIQLSEHGTWFGGCQSECVTQQSVTGGLLWSANPPSGDFTIGTVQNHQPVGLTVGTLTDRGSPTPTYTWDLNGDGTYGDAANVPNPSTAALGPGDHTVGLELTNSEGVKTDITHVIHVTDTPATGDFTIGTVANHQPVALTVGTIADSDSTTAPTYTWDLNGDGTYGDDPGVPNPSTAALAPGDHTVGLEITDSDGMTTDVTHVIHVTDTPATGDFTIGTVANHQPVALTVGTVADTDDTTAPTYTWDLNGDGTYGDAANVANPSTAALGVGDHTVGLEITDSDGMTTDVTHVIHVTDTPATGDFTIGTPTAGQPVQLTAGTIADADDVRAPTYTWDLDGDGTYGDAPGVPNPSTAALAPGDYTVGLEITDGDGVKTDVTHVVHVPAAPGGSDTGSGGSGSGGSDSGGSGSGGTGGSGTGGSGAGGSGAGGSGAGGSGAGGSGAGGSGAGGSGTGGSGAGPGVGGQSGPGSTKALTAKLTIKAQKLTSTRKSGIAITIVTNGAATIKLSLKLSAKLAKKYKLTGNVGTLTVKLSAAGTKTVRVKLSKKAAAKLKHARSLSFVVSGTAASTAGQVKLSKPLTLT